jgi:hypothetical protein
LQSLDRSPKKLAKGVPDHGHRAPPAGHGMPRRHDVNRRGALPQTFAVIALRPPLEFLAEALDA